jgi:hypothetical protein
MKSLPLLLNFALYQCVWFACVLGAAGGNLAAGLVLALLAIAVHLFRARDARREFVLVGIAAVTGAAFESLLVASGWVHIDDELLLGGLLPVGMVALWAAFATTLNVSLRALRSHHALAAVLAALGAPLAYAGGVRLGALEWVQVLPALAFIAVGWALLLPLLLRAARRFDGFTAS